MHPLHQRVATLIERVGTDVILPRFGKLTSEHIRQKAVDDLVTVVDHESEERLAEGLARILPEAGIVGEEAAAENPALLETAGNGLRWIIDPIDGTDNFAAGRAPFGVLVALVDDGITQAGWLFDPIDGRLCHAFLGHGAWIDAERVRAEETGADLPIAAIATGYMERERATAIRARAQGKLKLVDIPKCAAEQYPRLVLGQNDIAVFERALPWDHAAGVLFVNEAGGRVCRLDGSPYRVGDLRPGLLGAASPRLWDEAARILFD